MVNVSKSFLLCLVTLVFSITSCTLLGNNLPSDSSNALYVNTTNGLAAVDAKSLKVIDEAISIGQSIMAITADNKNIYLSDSGVSDLSNDDNLFSINSKERDVIKVKAPSAQALVNSGNNIYGTFGNSLRFIFNKTNSRVTSVDLKNNINMIGLIESKPIFFKGKRLWLGKQIKSLAFDNDVDQAAILNQGSEWQIVVLVGKSVYLVNEATFQIEKKYILNFPPDYRISPFAYKQKLYYSFGENNFKFNKLAVLDLKTRNNYLISTPGEPNNVILNADKLYFTFVGNTKKSNIVMVVNQKTGKIIKKIPIGKSPSGAILIGKNLFVANSADQSVSVINIKTDKLLKNITLKHDPISFATTLQHSDAINLTLY